MLTHEREGTRTIHSATPLSCGGIIRIRFKGYNLSRLCFLKKAADTPKVRPETYHTEAPFSRKRGGPPPFKNQQSEQDFGRAGPRDWGNERAKQPLQNQSRPLSRL